MRVVVVKTSAMGDVVQALRVAEYLKVRQGVETVGWVVEQPLAPFVESVPYVDVVLPIDSKKIRSSSFPSAVSELRRQSSALSQSGPWDIAFDLQGNVKSMAVNMSLNAKVRVGYGWSTAPEKLNLLSTNIWKNPPKNMSMRDEYLWLVQSYFGDDARYVSGEGAALILTSEQKKMVESELQRWPDEKPIWVVSCGSKWPNKTCRPSTMISMLEQASAEVGGIFFVFVAGSYEELKEVGSFASHFISSSVVLFRPDLPVLSQLIAKSDRVVAMDSLILHLAAMSGVPTFSFFGPSSGQKYAPVGNIHAHFQGRCPLGVAFTKRCHILRSCASGACLKDASVDEMSLALLQWNRRVTADRKAVACQGHSGQDRQQAAPSLRPSDVSLV